MAVFVRVIAACLVLPALSLGACAVAAPPATERVLSGDGYAQALREAEKTYSWPADRRPDIEKVIRDSGPTGGEMAEEGLIEIVLSMVNACAWYLSWSDAVKQGRMEQASRRLPMLSSLPMARLDPGSAKVAEQIAASARAGDTEPAIGYAQANCDNVRWVEIPGA